MITAMDNSNHHGQGSQDSREMPEQARLRKSAFRTAFLKFVFSLSWLLILPHFRSLNWLVSLFRPTTDEAKNAALVRRALIPVAVICVLVTAPVCLFVLPLYVLSHLGRRPFTYHVMAEVCMFACMFACLCLCVCVCFSASLPVRLSVCLPACLRFPCPLISLRYCCCCFLFVPSQPAQTAPFVLQRAKRDVHKTAWTIASCNAQLLPEALARKHNLHGTAARAKQLALRIRSATCAHRAPRAVDAVHEFPVCEFIALQQVHEQAAVDRILYYLNAHWPFILEDSGVLHWRQHRLIGGSGLMLLSKYPIMDAEYKQFPGPAGRENNFSRGILMAKVWCACRVCSLLLDCSRTACPYS